MRYYLVFQQAIPHFKVDCSRVTHPFATDLSKYCYPKRPVRLACLNHAASVHSEPGSNSPKRVLNLVILNY